MFMSSQPQLHRVRRVARVITGIPATDGSAIKRNRPIGTAMLDRVDPFLLFEEFHLDAADPNVAAHEVPYRGFEVISYTTSGTGEAQWLTAGRGMLHADLPDPAKGPVHGIQLWLNLPSAEKMQPPVARHIEAADIPAVIFPSAEVRVLAGQYHGLKGPIDPPTTQPFLAEVILKAEGEVMLDIPEDHDGFVYVLDGGGVVVGQTIVNGGQVGILDNGNILNMVAGASGARVFIATARPLKESVARHGPFVMNTSEELKQAFSDYQDGLF